MKGKIVSVEKIFRVLHIALCYTNIGALFFGLMQLTGGGNIVYSVFRRLSLMFSMPMVFLRIAYLQYILWGIIAAFMIVNVIRKTKTHSLNKKTLILDCTFWILAIIELICLENYFNAIIHF